MKKHGFPDECDCPSEDLCRMNEAREARELASLQPVTQATEPDMRAICAALGFDPTNHHNAAKCPYCRPATQEAVERQPLTEELAMLCDELSAEYGGVAVGPFATDFGKAIHEAMAVGAKNCAAAIRSHGIGPATQEKQHG